MTIEFPTAITGVTILATQDEAGEWVWSGGSVGPFNQDRASAFFASLVPDGYAAPPPSPPPATVPQTITNAQCRVMLLNTPNPANSTQTLFDVVDAAMKAAGGAELQFWEYANEIDRNGALVSSMISRLGLTSAQVDQMFIQAAALTL